VDATCTPADIRYPTDMSILNEARMNAETFIDYLYYNFREHFENKPRDYREIAHKSFIAYTKQRKHRRKVRRKALRKQLNYLRRDILLKISEVDVHRSKKLLRLVQRHEIIKEINSQQEYMYTKKVNRVDNRIVSVSQPHVRPIVRGKAGKAVEFIEWFQFHRSSVLG